VANQVANRMAGGAIMQQSKLFDQLPAEWDDLTANVSIGFPILGIKGGKWHYRFKGEDQILMDATGRFPTPAVQVVILKAQKELSRTYYQSGYVEGVNAQPDCWSSDGVAPDNSVANPVNPVCATCPCDAWGSGATPAAPKAKACQQRRRTVVVPYSEDLTNEMGGGPILLSVPPGSLTNQVTYGNMLRDNRIHYAGVVTELSFTQDPNIAFPKIEFNYVGSLTDAEAQVIIGMRDHEQVDRILVSKMIPAEMEATAPQETSAPQPAQQAAPRPAAAPQPQRAAPRPSVVRPPVQPAAPPQQPAPQQQAAPPPPPPPVQQAAPPSPPPVNRVGGFAMQPVRAAAPPPPPTQQAAPAGTIAGAMRTPAPPPPTQRPVIKTMAPAIVDSEVEEHADVAAGEPETTEGAIPQDMNTLFNTLMKAS
jgi:hypothetical protein